MLTTIHRRTASLAAAALFAATALAPAAPALARTDYVQDGAQLFSQGTDSRLDSEIGAFNRSTGKEIVIVTAPSLGGKSIRDAAEQTFSQQRVNGVLFYLSKAEKQDVVVPDRAAAAFFPSGTLQNVHQAMRGYFRGGDYDAGITTGVGLVLDQYRSHERGAVGGRRELAPTRSSFGGGMSLFWLILMLVVGFLVIRAIFRAISGRRVPPGYGGPGGYNQGGPPGYGGGPGYGGPGYGGYQGGMQGPMGGGMGRGGGFMSGLLGGLGGAFIGNELFGRHDGGMMGGDQAGFGGDQGSGVDNSGFQNDAGQADMGNSGGGGWGDSGGGGGDFGGGGDGGGW